MRTKYPPIFVAQKGFTLIELMIVVAIVAIIAAIAAPNLSQTSSADSSARELASALRFARTQALGGRANIVICAAVNVNANPAVCRGDGDWSGGWVIRTGTSTGNVIARYPVDNRNTITETGGTGALTFQARLGRSAAANFTVAANNGAGDTYAVTLLGSGFVNLRVNN